MMHDKVAYVIKHYAIVQLIYRNVMSFVFQLLGLFIKTDEKLVLLSSMSGDLYGGSPKVLYEYMKNDARFKGFRYVWAFSSPDTIKDDVTKVKIDSLSYFIIALKAKIWITDVNIERGLHFKKKNTIYLNTWHGTGPKNGGNAVAGRNDYDFSYVDIVCVDGKYARDEMVYCFNALDEHLLYCGRPREDELINFIEEDRIRVRKEFGIPDNKKVILYMPTWREYNMKPLDFPLWERMLGEDFIVLVRAHHFTKNEVLNNNNEKLWIDVTNYDNVNKLYLISDYLVSDYSSAFFDFGLLGKPMVCFAYDFEEYVESNGLLMDLRAEFPNGLKRTDREVLDYIINCDYEKECKLCKAYCDSYVSHKGNATKACVDRIYKLMMKNE